MKILLLGLLAVAVTAKKPGHFFGKNRDFVVQVHRPHEGASESRDQPEPETVLPPRDQPNVDNPLKSKGMEAELPDSLHNLLAEGVVRRMDENDARASAPQAPAFSRLRSPPAVAVGQGSREPQPANARRLEMFKPSMLKKAKNPKLDSISRQIEELLKERERLSAQAKNIIQTSSKQGSRRVQDAYSVTTPASNILPSQPTPRPAPRPQAPKPKIQSQPRARTSLFQRFESQPSGAARIIPLTNARTVPIEVSGVAVPKFSKMISNRGLNLLTRDETAVPVEKMEDVRAALPAVPAVQGFRVKGDPSNRVIFLNVAALGLRGDASGMLKLGNMELIPIDEHTRFDNTVEPDSTAFISRDALSKMINTHIQHRDNVHQTVNLPTFRQDRRLADQLPAGARQAAPAFRAQGRAQSSQSLAETRPSRPANRKAPVFFSRFGGLTQTVGGLREDSEVRETQQVNQQQPRGNLPQQQQRVNSPQQQQRVNAPQQQRSNAFRQQQDNVVSSRNTQSFSSFPSRSNLELPARQTQPRQQPAPRRQTVSDQLGEFDSYLQDVEQPIQSQNRFSSSRQQQSFSSPQQQSFSSPQQQSFSSPQQQRFSSPQQQQTFSSPQQRQPNNFNQNRQVQGVQQSRQPVELDPRIQAQIQQQQQAPGVETVLRQQEELRALNLEHSEWNDKLNRENNYIVPEVQTRQQQQQFQPQQQQQFQQPRQPRQHLQEQSQTHQSGLDQHARFVSELKAAQDALSALS